MQCCDVRGVVCARSSRPNGSRSSVLLSCVLSSVCSVVLLVLASLCTCCALPQERFTTCTTIISCVTPLPTPHTTTPQKQQHTTQRGIDVLMNKESKRETPAVVSFGDKMRFIGTDGAAKIR